MSGLYAINLGLSMINWNDVFTYDPTSPSGLRWKYERRGGNKYQIVVVAAGDVAGCPDSGGYYMVRYAGRSYLVHRVIWELNTLTKLDKDEHIDHLDGNPANNILTNLRVASRKLNSKNRRIRLDNSTGFPRVSRQSNGSGNRYIVHQQKLVSGKLVKTRWPIAKFGEDEAIRLAVEYDKSITTQLLAEGYTERHINGN